MCCRIFGDKDRWIDSCRLVYGDISFIDASSLGIRAPFSGIEVFPVKDPEAEPRGIDCEFEVPTEAWMLLELREEALAGRSGMVKFQPEFREAI